MPMHQTVAIFLASLAIAGLAAASAERLRKDLLRPIFWLCLLAVASLASAVSLLAGSTRHSGTGFTTSYGWPKPFYFRYLSETGQQSSGWSFIYFVGNALVFAGALLILWTLFRASRRSSRQ